MIDLQGAMAHWGTDPWPAYRETLDRELDRMPGYGVTVNFGVGYCRILHAYPVVGFGPTIELLPEGDGRPADFCRQRPGRPADRNAGPVTSRTRTAMAAVEDETRPEEGTTEVL